MLPLRFTFHGGRTIFYGPPLGLSFNIGHLLLIRDEMSMLYNPICYFSTVKPIIVSEEDFLTWETVRSP